MKKFLAKFNCKAIKLNNTITQNQTKILSKQQINE